MPIEIHEVEVLSDPAPATAPPAPSAPTPASSPTEPGEQLRDWQRELAARARRLRAD